MIQTTLKKQRTGLTLVELLVALTLSAMLMAVLLGMVSRHSRMNKRLIEKTPSHPWRSLLRTQLQEDYSGCRHVIVGRDSLLIDGYSRSGPTRVRYSIVSDQETNWLYREQTSLLGVRTNEVNRELVCRSVSGFLAKTELSTDIAPGTLRLQLDVNEQEPLKVALVRHGGSR